MDMNYQGKVKLSEKLSELIKNNFLHQQKKVIQLEWKGNASVLTEQLEKEKQQVRSSNRMRKQPQRLADFLGTGMAQVIQ